MVDLGVRRNQMRITMVVMLFLFVTSPLFSYTAQSTWQNIMASSARRHYLQWPAMETEFFHMRFSEDDRALAVWLGSEADAAVKHVATILPHDTGDKRPWLVVVPDQETFKRVFGWGEGTRALGVYLADTIKVLTPRAWDWHHEQEQFDVFSQQGPLVHEYTHYVLDLRSPGNYTRWFSEGLAQLIEYEVLGYEWLEAGSSLANPLYELDDLDQNFDQQPNQALVYRQALSMVSYMQYLQGTDGLNRFMDILGESTPFYQALSQVYGLEKEEFLLQWQEWYRQDARWFQVRKYETQ